MVKEEQPTVCCPLRKHQDGPHGMGYCIKEECAWYVNRVAAGDYEGHCAIKLIAIKQHGAR